MRLEARRSCNIMILQGVVTVARAQSITISGVMLKTKGVEMSKEMSSNSVGHLEIELLNIRNNSCILRSMQYSNAVIINFIVNVSVILAG